MYLSKNGPWGSVEAEITPAELLAFYKPHAEVYSLELLPCRGILAGRMRVVIRGRKTAIIGSGNYYPVQYLTVELLYSGITTMESSHNTCSALLEPTDQQGPQT